MASIQTAIQMQNSFNSALEEALGSITQMTSVVVTLDMDTSQVQQKAKESAGVVGKLMDKVKKKISDSLSMKNVGKILDLSDQLTSTTARLDLMNDGLQTTEELQQMIYRAAQQSGGEYQAVANTVASLGNSAGDSFSNSGETVAFVDQVRKQFALAGVEAGKIDEKVQKFADAINDGTLSGEEYKQVLSETPNIIQSIADYMGMPQSQLQSMAEAGKLTSSVIKSAMFATSDEVNAKFEKLPKTFSWIWTSFRNTALAAFRPVLERLSEFANSEGVQELIGRVTNGIAIVGTAISNIFDLLGGVMEGVAENWSILEPIILGVAAALAVYYGYTMLAKAATTVMTAATTAMATAQKILNAIMGLNPILLVVLGIIMLIALVYAAVAAINHFAGTSISATGVICGAFMAALAFIGNLGVSLVNVLIDFVVLIWNFIAAFANFLANVFVDPVGAIARLFFDLVDGILSLLQSLASAIDTIFGSHLSDAVQGWRDKLGGWVDNTFGEGKKVLEEMNAQDYHLKRFEYGAAYDKGYAFGSGIDEKLSNLDFGKDIKLPSATDYSGDLSNSENLAQTAANTGDMAQNTEKLADTVEISSEDLKYIRDMAEQDYINRFTTAQIVVNQTNNNTVKGEMDLDGITERLRTTLEGQMNAAAEGVH